MAPKKSLRISMLVILSYISMIVVNALANILPIGGMNTGAISDSYPNLFAPAGITFSIWAVIYLTLALYCIYQCKEPHNSIGILFVISSVANLLWIFCWHYHKIGLSVLLMIVILLSLGIINLKLKKLKPKNIAYYSMQLPFSLYFGWITVATIANITTFLVAIGWNGWGLTQSSWTVMVLLTGFVIALIWVLSSKDIPYLTVLIWAYLGILIKHLSSEGFAKAYPSVIAATTVCLLLFVILLVLLIFKKR